MESVEISALDPGRDAAGDEAAPDDLLALLQAAVNTMRAALPGGAAHARRLDELARRLAAGRLRVAVLGQFKRGKSTLLNALLGGELLPSGVVPLTAVPTFLRWGAENRASVVYLAGERTEEIAAADYAEIAAALRAYATEEGNPHNRAGVARVEVSLALPLLASGIELVDTPGIGSTLQHNTDAAIGVLPECDAAFFVVSVDPPLTAAELDYLDRVRTGISPILFVLNKIDYLSAADRRHASDFLRKALGDHAAVLAAQPIFELSARNALRAKTEQDDAAFEESGLAALERHLSDRLLKAKRGILCAAVVQKAGAILEDAGTDAALGVRALELPLGELAVRARRFGEAVADIERQRLVAADLLAGDRRRMREAVERQADELRGVARAGLLARVDDAFGTLPNVAVAAEHARAAVAEAIPQLFQDALQRTAGAIAAELEQRLAGHVERAEAVVGAVRRSAAQLFDIPYAARGAAEGFIPGREPYWVTQKWDDALLPLAAGLVDRLMPASAARSRAKQRIVAEVDGLVARNIENLRWATLQNIDDAFRRFSAWFDERLREAIEATQGAIVAAQDRRQRQSGEAEGELRRLRAAQDWVAATVARLRDLPLPEPAMAASNRRAVAGAPDLDIQERPLLPKR